MNSTRNVIYGINSKFHNAEVGRQFFTKISLQLEEQWGFDPDNTRFAEGECCDEINEPELIFLQHYWGERYKFGGLGGYCHGGRSGMEALSQHVAEVDGEKNILLVCGPHIGFHDDEWGFIPRIGMSEATDCCGAVAKILREQPCAPERQRDVYDMQFENLRDISSPYFEETEYPNIIGVTEFLLTKTRQDLYRILEDVKVSFEGSIAVVTGITVNTKIGNFVANHEFQVF